MKDASERMYRRVSAEHPLDLFIDPSDKPGYLMLRCDDEPCHGESLSNISICHNKLKDGRWALIVELRDDRFVETFKCFCQDIIESSSDISNTSAGPGFIIGRYNEWKKMFERPSGELGRNQIQGLIGEMLALRDVLIPRYGQRESLLSWMNPRKGKQDFIGPDRWYEVKAVKKGSQIVSITSLDQLDRNDEGELVVIMLSETSPLSPRGITINSLFDSLIELLETPDIKGLFSEIMASAGYCKLPTYDDIAFEFEGFDEYEVRDEFPRLRRSEINMPAIADASYNITISHLAKFKR
jgi:hypothetical protein